MSDTASLQPFSITGGIDPTMMKRMHHSISKNS